MQRVKKVEHDLLKALVSILVDEHLPALKGRKTTTRASQNTQLHWD